MKRSTLIYTSLLMINFTLSLTAGQSSARTVAPAQRALVLRIPASLLQRCANSCANLETRLSESLTNQDEYFKQQLEELKENREVNGCPEMGAGLLSLSTVIARLFVTTGKKVCSAGARFLGGQAYAC